MVAARRSLPRTTTLPSPTEGQSLVVQGQGQQLDRVCCQRRKHLGVFNGGTQLSGEGALSVTEKPASITALHVPPLSQRNGVFRDFTPYRLMMANQISTRVPAPAFTNWSNRLSTTGGLTSYAGTTTTRHQLTCGEDPPHVVIRE